MSQWYKDNFHKENYEKYVMLLGRNKEKPPIKGMVDNKPTESSLGVTVDDNLYQKVHISDICKKNLDVLSSMRNMLPTQAKLQLYKSAILANLTCHTVWYFRGAPHARKLEGIQE